MTYDEAVQAYDRLAPAENARIDALIRPISDQLHVLACEVSRLRRRWGRWTGSYLVELSPQEYSARVAQYARLTTRLVALRQSRPVHPIHRDMGRVLQTRIAEMIEDGHL